MAVLLLVIGTLVLLLVIGTLVGLLVLGTLVGLLVLGTVLVVGWGFGLAILVVLLHLHTSCGGGRNLDRFAVLDVKGNRGDDCGEERDEALHGCAIS